MAKKVQKNIVTLNRLTVEEVPIDSIRPNTYNPNRQSDHDFELLCRSIEQDGFTQPIIVQREKMEIVDGEHRWRALKALGYTKVPVVFVDMTQEQMLISTLRHNRARGSEDVGLAGEVLRELQASGATDMIYDSLMLSPVELDQIGAQLGKPDLPERTAKDLKDFNALQSALQRETDIRSQARESERQQRSYESEVYKLVLVFTLEEGEIVNQVLGKSPARKIVELCRRASNAS